MPATSDRVITTGRISMMNIALRLNLPITQQRTMWLLQEVFGSTFLEVEIDFAKKQIGIFVEDLHHNIAGICAKEDIMGLKTMFVGVGIKDKAQHQKPKPWLKGATHGVETSHALLQSYREEMTSRKSDIQPWGVMDTPRVKATDMFGEVIYQSITLSHLLSMHTINDFPTDLFQEVFGEFMVYITASATMPLMYEIRIENQHGQVAGCSGHIYGRDTGCDIGFLQAACGMKAREGEEESAFLTGASEKTTQMMTKMKFTEKHLNAVYDPAHITLHTTQQP